MNETGHELVSFSREHGVRRRPCPGCIVCDRTMMARLSSLLRGDGHGGIVDDGAAKPQPQPKADKPC